MTLSDLFRHAFAGLGQHKLRCLLTLMGVILGALLLFTSLSGGLGVINAVNERLAIGNRLLEVNVTTGVKVDEVTVETARVAGFTQDINDERSMRLAKASGLGGITKVPVTLATVEKLKQMPHVSQAWALLRFSASVQFGFNDSPAGRWSKVSVEAIPPFANPYASLIVAGNNAKPDSVDEVLVSEYYLYQQGVRTDQQFSEVIGTKLRILLPQTSPKDDAKSLTKPDREVTIVGVYRHPTRDELNKVPELVAAVSRQVLVPYALAVQHWEQIGNGDRPISAKVLADDPENVAAIEQAISKQGFRTISLSELALQIRTAVLLITCIITAIAGGALFISAIGITNTMVMNSFDNRHVISVLFLAEGCRRQREGSENPREF